MRTNSLHLRGLQEGVAQGQEEETFQEGAEDTGECTASGARTPECIVQERSGAWGR